MIRKFCPNLLNNALPSRYSQRISTQKIGTIAILRANWTPIRFHFGSLPRHDVLSMPALSPTMSEGKIVKWLKKVGDQVDEGDVICEIETDKATVGFEVQDKGFIAQIKDTEEPVPVGTPVVVVVKKQNFVKDFQSYSFDGSGQKAAKQTPKNEQKTEAKQESTQKSTPSKNYPRHNMLTMPALSPTMSEGKIAKWIIKEGQQYSEGDALCEIETDKATVAFEASEKGVLAKILAQEGNSLKVGENLGVSVKKKADADKFSDFKVDNVSSEKKTSSPQSSQKQSKPPKQEATPRSTERKAEGQRIFASPAAKTLASQKGISLSDIGSGSGPDGRIIRQDVESFTPAAKEQPKQESKPAPQQQKSSEAKPTPSKKVDFPENPYEEISVNNMRKTIAARLTESKTTIPHYYVKLSIQMDAVTALRAELNKNEKDNGVKISVNDIMVKAMALALRDYPTINAQWHGSVVKQFKYADVSVAVATEGGLITPIVYRADTLGLLDIARRTKDIAKRAREGKLDPREYIGGTSTISNLGMFGIDSVTSVINPPQSTILGVGKTEKKILFDEKSINPDKPYRVAEVCELIVSADHRVVDGAMAAQWLTRIKKYLENPTHMLL